MSLRTSLFAASAVSALALGCAHGQPPATTTAPPQPATAAPKTPPPTLGTIAPDFTLPGATRYGVLQKPASLSDYKGKTVVLAFFFRARTRG